MTVLADLRTYGRFLGGLRSFLRQPISLEEARTAVERRLTERDTAFLRLLERGVFGYPRSPYLPLLKSARCELGDIRNMLRTTGLEGTLSLLRAASVYITFEEFKGREPIVRNGQVFQVAARDFDNPSLRRYYRAESGGSTGPGTRAAIDLDHLAAQAPHLMLTRAAHGILDAPTVIWFGVLPDPTGLAVLLRDARFGRLPDRWFSPTEPGAAGHPLRYRLATECALAMSRVSGVRMPRPEPLSLEDGGVVARWAAHALQARGACLIRGAVSKAVRVSIAAEEAGLDLTGATFMGGSEPPTPAKVARITGTGARWVPTYFFTEAGAVGLGCARPVDGNDLHLLEDALAVIQHPHRIPGTDITVDAFHFTSLLPTAPKLMLNVESDDYGVVEERACGCALESHGLRRHLREIRSFRKLTGEGVTLVGSEMIAILEDALPRRFGGSPLDYQLLEEEDDAGFTRLSLLVSPRLKIADERAVIATVLEALGRGSVAASVTRAIWSQAGTLRVKRIEPFRTLRGKLLPLHVMRRGEHSRERDTGAPGSAQAAQPGKVDQE